MLSKRVSIGGVLVMLILLAAVACARAAPTPAPAPVVPSAPAPQVATTPAPGPTPTSAPAPAAAPTAQPPRPVAVQPKRGGTFRWAQTGDPPTLDPHHTSTVKLVMLETMIFGRLLKYDAGSHLVPDANGALPLNIVGDLAESWTIPDASTYIFTLRKGIKWHNRPPVNGRELTSEDIKFSFDRNRSKESKSVNVTKYEVIESIETPDKYTVKFNLREPSAPFISFLADPKSAWIVPPEILEQYKDYNRPEAMVGMGPFLFESYEPRVTFKVKRNPDYFQKGLPYVDGVTVLFVGDDVTITAAFLARQLDWWGFGAKKTNVDTILKARPDAQYLKTAGTSNDNFSAVMKPPFDDLDVRRAIQKGINWERICERVSRGECVPYNGPISIAHTAALSQTELKKYSGYDPQAAKAFLAKSGYPRGFKSTIWAFVEGYGPEAANKAQLIIEDLKPLGIELTFIPEQIASGRRRAYERDFDMYAGGLGVPAFDPDFHIYAFFHSKGDRNFNGLSDPKLDRMLEETRRITDPPARDKALQAAARYILDQAYVWNATSGFSHDVAQPYVKGFFTHPSQARLVAAEVWLDK